jgi:hypothetical protein
MESGAAVLGRAVAGRGWTDQDREGRPFRPALGEWVRSRMADRRPHPDRHAAGRSGIPDGIPSLRSTGAIDASAWSVPGCIRRRARHRLAAAASGGSPTTGRWCCRVAVSREDPVRDSPRSVGVPWLRLSNRRSLTLRDASSVRSPAVAGGNDAIRFEVGGCDLIGALRETGPVGTGADGARRGHGVDAAGPVSQREPPVQPARERRAWIVGECDENRMDSAGKSVS